MKNNLTKNLGLKIVSLFAAFFLWLLVVNVDDPVISRTYTGIPVEVLNEKVIEDEGKCYEILNGTNAINVVVTAKRSVVDQMSRDYIKATADFASMTFLDKVPIEVRSTRYSDQIDSISSRTEYLKIELEDVIERNIPVNVYYEGSTEEGFVLAGVDADKNEITIVGPESEVNTIAEAMTVVDITGFNKDTIVSTSMILKNEAGNEVVESRITIEKNNLEVNFLIDPIKEIPVSCGYSGTPLNGYVVNGAVLTTPSSVRISGRGENFDDMDVIYIPPNVISVDGAMADIEENVDISDYLPSGVIFADADFEAIINVQVAIEATMHKTISVPLSNITIDNIPEGYIAHVIDIGNVEIEIQGLGDTFDRYSGDLAIGVIDAASLIPTTIIPEQEGAPLQTGENLGMVTFDMPIGISVVNPISLRVIVDYIGNMPLVQAGAFGDLQIPDANSEIVMDEASEDVTEHSADHNKHEESEEPEESDE